MTEPGGMGIRSRIGEALAGAVRSLGVDGELPDLELGRAKGLGHGDYASPAGLKLARVLRKAPPQIAETIAKTIAVPDGAATAEAAGGYINFRLTAEWLQQLVADVASRGGDYGAADLGRGERLQVGFGSINPARPMHHRPRPGVVLGGSVRPLPGVP